MNTSHRIFVKTIAATALASSAILHAQQSAASSQKEERELDIKQAGSQPSRTGPAENFTDSVRVDPLFQANDPLQMTGAGATLTNLVIDAAVLVLLVVAASIIVTESLSLPPIGLWLTIAAGNLIAAACFTIYYLRGSFLDKQV
jgi:hypothetical protein